MRAGGSRSRRDPAAGPAPAASTRAGSRAPSLPPPHPTSRRRRGRGNPQPHRRNSPHSRPPPSQPALTRPGWAPQGGGLTHPPSPSPQRRARRGAPSQPAPAPEEAAQRTKAARAEKGKAGGDTHLVREVLSGAHDIVLAHGGGGEEGKGEGEGVTGCYAPGARPRSQRRSRGGEREREREGGREGRKKRRARPRHCCCHVGQPLKAPRGRQLRRTRWAEPPRPSRGHLARPPPRRVLKGAAPPKEEILRQFGVFFSPPGFCCGSGVYNGAFWGAESVG